jgi:hypothetical protein
MSQPIAPDYEQQFLLPPALGDWVGADHPVRFLREFVEQLDWAALGFVIPSAAQGRPVEIWPHTAVVQALRTRLVQPTEQALLRQRSQIIEPRFAQVKEHDRFRRWTVRGLTEVQTQWSLVCAPLNLRVLYRRWCDGTAGAAVQAEPTVPGNRPPERTSISQRLGQPVLSLLATLDYW